MFDAVFFDLDGTLVDTEALALRSNLRVFADHGHPVDADFLHSMIGKDEPSVTRWLQETLPHLDAARLQSDLHRVFYEDLEAGLDLKPGARQLLDSLQVPAVLVTSSGRKGALRKLELTGILPAFASLITVDEVTKPKPDPQPYLMAAESLGLPPQRCLVFEDSEPGAEAGYRAGCTVVQVRDVLPPSGRWAHHTADDLLSGARMAGLPV
ncbi:HAD family phosphatase [Xinfangfangia sp. D13-10-4-6]|uniref:HAD family hydrolase n=1 Tax=Pseudogemmobacter hezensis TaxID=2737662 RepID=UPI0015532CBC|nr:HAD family phosphatase [Pseudogemmobacter hezensis]NPD14357.1 HAD family phosphatase [Pseudogemmobacter hezensis]